MSKKFVRNITNTRIKGAIQEPLNTNVQNDILSDDEDVAIRNKDEYHLLTDNVKSITSANDGIKVKVTGKNSRELVAKIVELTSETDEVSITNPETNVFTIAIDFSGYTDKTLFENEIQRLENEIENVEVDLTDYATKTYVDNAINEIDVPEVDLSEYVSKFEYSMYENAMGEGWYEYSNNEFIIKIVVSLIDDTGSYMEIPIDSQLSIFTEGEEPEVINKFVTEEMIIYSDNAISVLQLTLKDPDRWHGEFLNVMNGGNYPKNIFINVLDTHFLNTLLYARIEEPI